MPPATASFFKQSRNKMQAWVTNNPGLGHSQPGVATSAPATAYDPSPPEQIQSQSQPQPPPPQPQPQPQTQTRHVNISQAKPPTTQQSSPGRSRSPIINANSQRAATVAAARIPMPSRSTHTHAQTRDGPVNLPRTKAASSEPLQQSKRPAPFWEGSTIEGSAFSDTASNIDSNTPFAYRQVPVQIPAQMLVQGPVQGPVQGHPALTYQQHDSPPHRPAPRHPDRVEQPPPFTIGANGLINVIGNENGNGLTRSASTPEARNPRGGFKDVISDDQYVDESPYNTSPEKTPSGKRLQHAKTLTLRPTRRDSYPERISYSNGDAAAIPQPLRPHVYLNPSRDEPAGVPPVQPDRFPRLQVPELQPQRSTIFADTDTPMVSSHQGESENASVEREPTPMPVTKPITKAKTQVNRQLFARPSKGKASLRESALPRSSPEKHQPATKKRSYELDYDDGALAAMDYAALREEAFDFDPAQAEARSVFEPPRGTLPEKLEHFFTKDKVNQTNFFTKMPVQDWEDSGDWFLERFGEIMTRFKEARKEKRDIVNAFENEIAEREEAVRNKIHGIGQTLAELKTEGEGMMLNKEFN
ncbi:extracellular mutant protein 11-domain-containing protein [Xylaria cf. heliscus]|nr:extracellular mutant protein 11-domain-containing protein [Xylaria cf. heliscus]